MVEWLLFGRQEIGYLYSRFVGYVATWVLPMQGFFNALVYLRPRYLAYLARIRNGPFETGLACWWDAMEEKTVEAAAMAEAVCGLLTLQVPTEYGH